MKKLFIPALSAAALLCAPVYAENYPTAAIVVNGKTIDTAGIIKDGRTLVPVRGVFEELGYTVEWDAETKTAAFTNPSYVLNIQSGAASFDCYDRAAEASSAIAPDVPQQIIDGHFYIPLRAVSESVGAAVAWDAETKTASITQSEDSYQPVQLQAPKSGDTVATLHTNKGDISVRMFPQYAPKAVENFVTHSNEGYYDGVTFHRVISDFMIQSGDPTGTGAGGESIWGGSFENETSWDLRNFRGALGMANAGENTNGSQFYIVQCSSLNDGMEEEFEKVRSMKDEVYYTDENGRDITYGEAFPDEIIDAYIENGGCPWLDMGYTVFGQVYAGLDVVDDIAAVETDTADKPLEDIVINSIEVFTY